MTLDAFTIAYVEAALWSTNDESTPEGGEPLDSNYGINDIASDTIATMVADCATFQAENASLLIDDNCHYKRCPMFAYAGHDFWLTRNHYGCGFWDGDWEEAAGKALTEAASRFRQVDLYVGDDGLIYC